MGIDECLEPCPSSFIANLDDMGQDYRVIILDEILNCRWVFVEFSIKGCFGLGDSGLDGNGRVRRGDGLCR